MVFIRVYGTLRVLVSCSQDGAVCLQAVIKCDISNNIEQTGFELDNKCISIKIQMIMFTS